MSFRFVALLTFLAFASAGNFQYDNIQYSYEEGDSNDVTWYEAYDFCESQGKFMVEFPDDLDWDNFQQNLPTSDEYWIGLIAMGDGVWWQSGRVYGGDTSSQIWHSTQPFQKTETTPQCCRIKNHGSKLNLELQECTEDKSVPFCQDHRIISIPPFLVGSIHAFMNTALDTFNQAETFCDSFGYEVATLKSNLENTEVYNQLNTFSDGETEKFYIGLEVKGGSLSQMEWSDGTSLADSGFNAFISMPSDGGDPCVTLDRTLAAHESWEKTGCSATYGAVCSMGMDQPIPFRDTHFMIRTAVLPYSDAQSSCQAMDATLAFVKDPGVQTYLESLIAQHDPSGSSRWWIGLSYVSSDWRWPDDEVYTYYHASSNPSASSGCVAIDQANSNNWSVQDCSVAAKYICQLGSSVFTTTAQPTTQETTTAETTALQTTTEETTALQTTTEETTTLQTTTQETTALQTTTEETTILQTTTQETTALQTTTQETTTEETTTLQTTTQETTTLQTTIEETTPAETTTEKTTTLQTTIEETTTLATTILQPTTEEITTLPTTAEPPTTDVTTQFVPATSDQVTTPPLASATQTSQNITMTTTIQLTSTGSTSFPTTALLTYSGVTGVYEIDQSQDAAVTNRDRKFNVTLTSSTSPVCVIIDYGDGMSDVIARDDVECGSRFNGNALVVDASGSSSVVLNHRYTWIGGVYNISVKCYNNSNVNNFHSYVTITIESEQEPYGQITSFKHAGPPNNVTARLNMTLDDPDTRVCVLVVFGDASEGDIIVARHVSDATCRDLFESYGSLNKVVQKLDNFVQEIVLKFNYTRDGTYNISAYHYNGSTIIKYEENHSFTAELGDCSAILVMAGSSNSSLLIYASDTLNIASHFTVHCPQPHQSAADYKFTFNWASVNCLNEVSSERFYPEFRGVSASFAPRTFTLGCQLIRVTMSMVGLGSNISYTAEREVNVKRSNLVAMIYGGSTRTLGRLKDILIDAQSVSYDPDTGSYVDLEFVFIYKLLPHGAVHTIGNTSLTEIPPVSLEGDRLGVLRIKSPSNDLGDDVTVTVAVRSSDGRRSEFTQRIRLVDLPPPNVIMSCLVNCADNIVHPELGALYQIDAADGGSWLQTGGFTFTWSIELDSNNSAHIVNIADSSNRQLYIPPYTLRVNNWYYVSCDVIDKQTGAQTTVTSKLGTDQVPYGGSCAVTPTIGRSLSTLFTFQCSDWKKDSVLELPPALLLEYKFYVNDSGQMNLLTHAFTQQSLPTLAPPGKDSNNHSLQVTAMICKRTIFCAKVILDLTVYPFTEEDLNKSGDIVDLAVNTENVDLLAQVVKSVLLDPKTNFSADINNSTESQNSSKRLELRTSLVIAIDKLVHLKPSVTLNDVSQLSEALEATTSSDDDVTSPMTSVGSRIASELSGNMLRLVERTSVPQAAVVDISTKLVASFGNFLNSQQANVSAQADVMLYPQLEQYKPVADDVNDLSPREILYRQNADAEKLNLENELLENKRRQVVENVMNGSELVTQTMTKANLVHTGNDVASVTGDVMNVSVLSLSGEGKPLQTESISDTKVELSSTKAAKARVEILKQNPFLFDETSFLVNSPVARLQMTSDGVGPIADEAAVTLRNRPVEPSVPVALRPGSASTSRFELRSSSNVISIYFRVTESSSRFRVLLRHKAPPLLANYTTDPDVTHDVTDHVFEFPLAGKDVTSQEAYRVFLPQGAHKGEGVYYVTTELLAAVGRQKRSLNSNETQAANISMSISTPACSIYDEVTTKWSAGNCEVSETSSSEETVCVCPVTPGIPLTVGAQFFVPPNTIDFSSVFSKVDVVGNGAVLWTLVSIVVTFGLLLLWLRRKDKQDREEWSTKWLADNTQGHSYFYKVTFITGMCRHSGTSSQVSFTVAGEDGATGPRLAQDTSGKFDIGYTLIPPWYRTSTDTTTWNQIWMKSGSVVHFLMSTHTCLGDLEYIRVWHNNAGKNRHKASWFLNDVLVQDLHTNEMFVFPCNKWLAVEHGDGLIDRLLPVAGHDNLSSFKRVFSYTARQKLTDGHLILSIFVNRPRSEFTRCQRAVCVMAALFLVMIANAMFYRDNSDVENTEPQAKVMIGPISLELKVIWISIVSMLIVLPPSLLLVELFRRTRANKVQHTGMSTCTMNTIASQPSGGTKHLPYWCTYVGWAIAIVAVLTAGFFCVLYSFQWGKEKSEAWLSSLILSFSEDSIVVQPIKVILIASIFAILCRKKSDPLEAWKEEQCDVITTPPTSPFDNGPEIPGKPQVCFAEHEEDTTKDSPEQLGGELSEPRFRAKTEKKAIAFVTEFLVYIFYIGLLFFIAYKGHQDYHLFRKVAELSNSLAAEDFEEISTRSDVWSYLEESLLPNVYPVKRYNGKKMNWRERIFISDEANYRLGPVRLRQMRRTPALCDNYEPLIPGQASSLPNSSTPVKRPCFHDNYLAEDSASYAPSWRKTNGSSDLEGWGYSPSGTTNALPILGKMALYGGGGYVVDLGVTLDNAESKIESLKSELWLDRASRALLVELSLYNANSDIFTSVNLLAEFLVTGGITATATIKPFRLYPTNDAIMVFGAAMVAGLFALYYTIITCRKMITLKKKFFHSAWNYVAIIRIALILVYVLLTIYQYNLQDKVLKTFQKDTYGFVNFQELSTVTESLKDLMAFINFVECVRVLQFLRHHKHMRRVAKLVKSGGHVIVGACVHFLLSFFTYTMVAILLFSSQLGSYMNFQTAIQSLFSSLLGIPTYGEMNQVSSVAGKVFYFMFSLHMVCLLLNMMIGIMDVLLQSVKQITSEYDVKEKYFHIFARYFANKVRRLFNIEEISIDEFLYPPKSPSVPDSAEEGEESDEKSSGYPTATKSRRNKRRRRKVKSKNQSASVEVSFTDEDYRVMESNQFKALVRLRKLERMVDSIDITTFSDSVAEPMNKKELVLSQAMDEANVIFQGFSDNLKSL